MPVFSVWGGSFTRCSLPDFRPGCPFLTFGAEIAPQNCMREGWRFDPSGLIPTKNRYPLKDSGVLFSITYKLILQPVFLSNYAVISVDPDPVSDVESVSDSKNVSVVDILHIGIYQF